MMTDDAAAPVDSGYRHVPKRCRSGPPVETHGAWLKWYDLFREDQPPPLHITMLARAKVAGEIAPAHLKSGELGFVILHRCGTDFYFLLVQVWRGANELWEAVWHIEGDQTAFTPFADAYSAAGRPRPTFCVWELGIVAAEMSAWTTYLASPRGEANARHYLDTHLDGTV